MLRLPRNKGLFMWSKEKNYVRLPQGEMVEALTELSANAFKLLAFYYSRSNYWEFEDSATAKQIGLGIKTFQKIRWELLDKGYLHIEKGRLDSYFIGKAAVLTYKKNAGLLEELI